MKRILLLSLFLMISVILIVYFTTGNDFIFNNSKDYELKSLNSVNLNLLNDFAFFQEGIISYNNQKIIYLNLDNKIIWDNETTFFADKIYVTDDYIYRNADDKIEILDRNNRVFELHEIAGNIINVSRENGITSIITKQNNGQNSIYMANEENEIVVNNKIFDDIITGVSPSDRSDAYAITTLSMSNGMPVSVLYFNLLDDVELWKVIFDNDIIIETKVVSNNVIAVGMNNIYYYNTNGKLMWKNSIYNKILDYEIDEEDERIYLLYEQNNKLELISYNLEGKVKELYNIPNGMKIIKKSSEKLIVFNENEIYILHDSKADKLYDNKEEKIYDIFSDNNLIYILLKDKLIKAQIR